VSGTGRRAYRRRATTGIAVYALLIVAPVSLMLLPPLAASRNPLLESSVALAFTAAGILGMQFVLAMRFAPLKRPYGIDAVYYFHRQMALVALGLVVLHPTLLFVDDPERLGLLNIFAGSWTSRFAVLAALAVIGIVGASLLRRRLPISYEIWHGLHAAGAATILALASLHIAGAGIYTDDWKLSAFLFYPALGVVALGYARVGKPLLKRGRPYVVEKVHGETPDVWTLTLRPDGHPGIRFRPGQHAWFTIGRSPFSLEEHPFSFSSSAEANHGGFDITVKELGDFTARIGQTDPGVVVYVDGPFGAFTTDRYPAPGYVFITGGVGITPVMSILRTAADREDRTLLRLVYGAQTAGDLAFAEELDSLSERLDLSITYVLEEPPEDWHGESGFITREIVEDAIGESGGHEFFACGPPAMTEAVERILVEMGIDRRRLHYERFDLA
jgi:predicted ferric reductase